MFNIKTTFQTDYLGHWPQAKTAKKPKTSYDPLEHLPKTKPFIQKDQETLGAYRKSVSVPCNLGYEPKGIVRTNPHIPVPEIKLKNELIENRLKARKIRPRVYMVPQMCLDNVSKEDMYGDNDGNGLVDYIYSSDWKQCTKFAVENFFSKKSTDVTEKETKFLDLKGLLDRSEDAVKFVSSNPTAEISPDYLKLSNEWDKLQRNDYVDATRLFWERNKNIALCPLCNPSKKDQLISEEEKDKINKCIKKKNLSVAYDYHHPSYTGYLPKSNQGVPMCKKTFRKIDPFVTTLMELHGVYK